MDSKCGEFLQELQREHEETPARAVGGRQEGNSIGGIQSRAIRLEFPRFDGMDPAGWVYKAEQFFAYHQTPPNQRISIISFYLEGKALQWSDGWKGLGLLIGGMISLKPLMQAPGDKLPMFTITSQCSRLPRPV